jgi:hypothetical protein
MTRQQALDKLKDRMLTDHERERIHQYLHYLDVEGVTPRPSPNSAKRPAQKNRHKPKAPHHAGKAK